MSHTMKFTRTLGAASVALLALTGTALAGDLFGREASIKDAPADEGRKFTYSFNIGGYSEYVFRGISQTDEDPTIQGGFDVGYGILYAGIWASDVEPTLTASNLEYDIYGGIKPVLGPATFDFGVIYYGYADQNGAFNAVDTNVDVDYWEFKAGVSGELFKGLVAGATFYYSPEYTFETGSVYTIEGSLGYTFPQVWMFTPTVSGLVGYQKGEDNIYLATNGFDEYTYWNAGLSLAVEKFTFDFRYWDTDIETSDNALIAPLADERFVFSAKVVLP